MAASVVMYTSTILPYIFVFFLLNPALFGHSESKLYEYEPQNILWALETSCFLSVDKEAPSEIMSTFHQLSDVFIDRREEGVTLGISSFDDFVWPDGKPLRIKGSDCDKSDFSFMMNCDTESHDILFFPRMIKDRSCLMSLPHSNPKAELYLGPPTAESIVDFLNKNCGTYLLANGHQSSAGYHRENILNKLFSVSQISDINMRKLVSSGGNPMRESYMKSKVQFSDSTSCENLHSHEKSKYTEGEKSPYLEIPTCPVIKTDLSREEFIHEYLEKSKPFIIKNAVKNWPAFTKWSQEYFHDQFGQRDVHVKMTPGGDFEGVEKAELWENYKTFTIPEEVRLKLFYPDLVVVRPAGVNMKFGEFLDLITWAAQQESRNVSAYLEYSSIPEHLPELEKDLLKFDFVKGLLKLRHLNIWLSDGNTLGRLHFDPYDNFLCQLRGSKQVTLFEPHHNGNLYEAHIPQATLGYMQHNHTFRRHKLEDSTSMVMSPVDLIDPDLQRFPKFGDALPLNCTIDEGDVLYMPAFWWHEVYSSPNKDENRNMAVNFWYEPFLTKEFPCPECQMNVNQFYRHLL